MAREDTGALDLLSYLAVEPTFPIKLFHLVCNTLTNSAISWTQSGDAFVITDPDTFAREILPTYFKHNNIRSLERQLNIYGFKRRTDLQTHVRKHLEFSHEKFRRDEPWLLTQIKRCEAKRSDSKAGPSGLATPAAAAGPAETSTGALTFPMKLFQIVSSASTDGSVAWTTNGDAAVISDPDVFAWEVLPTYFKHNNIRSFVRQLSIYGFAKTASPVSIEFSHESFRRGAPELLSQIKRNESSAPSAAAAPFAVFDRRNEEAKQAISAAAGSNATAPSTQGASSPAEHQAAAEERARLKREREEVTQEQSRMVEQRRQQLAAQHEAAHQAQSLLDAHSVAEGQ